MQAIILAAGFGKRLRPITDTKPKSMVPVKGTPLIINALNRMAESKKIDEVIIVVGHMWEVIVNAIGSSYKDMRITYVINNDYLKTNNVYSLYLAKDYINDNCLLFECDLYYNQDLVNKILDNENADCSILVSKFNTETMNGSAIISDNENNAKSLVIKRDQDKNFDYDNAFKTVNVYNFEKEFITKKLFPAIELYVKTGNLNSYYELVLGSLLYFGNDNIKINLIDESLWFEIDDANDLEIAENCGL